MPPPSVSSFVFLIGIAMVPGCAVLAALGFRGRVSTVGIDLDDWQREARYEPPEYAHSSQVAWFWKAVRQMDDEQKSRLLYFCTGSMRPPATGFGSLMGYNGVETRFTVARVDGAGTGRLPTAATCFNKLNLPAYAGELELRDKLHMAVSGAQGFHEGAVAT